MKPGAASTVSVVFKPRPLSPVQIICQGLEIHRRGWSAGGPLSPGTRCSSALQAARVSVQGSARETCVLLELPHQLPWEPFFPSNLTAEMFWHPVPPNKLSVLFNLLVTVILLFFFLFGFLDPLDSCRFYTKKIWGKPPQPLSLQRCRESNAIKRTLARYCLEKRKCF